MNSSNFDIKTYYESFSAASFCPSSDYNSKIKLLKRQLRQVVVEIFSFCNRKCSFCPNSFIDRQGVNKIMANDVFTHILRQLQELDFCASLFYSNYNEPLADRIILKRIAESRTMLPKACLGLNTNGDYLTPDYLKELEVAGLTLLKLQAYLESGIVFSPQAAAEAVEKQARKTGVDCRWAAPATLDIAMMTGRLNNLEIIIYCRNFDRNGTDRGGLVDINAEYSRISPCTVPFTDLYIEYNGNMVPCCNIRSDAEKHIPYVMGNVGQSSILDIYFHPENVAWRNRLAYFKGNYPEPCQRCFFASAEATPVNLELVEKTMLTSQAENARLENQLTVLQKEINQLKNSRSFRITRPLRWLADKGRKLRQLRRIET